MNHRFRTLLTAAAALGALYWQVPALADPPDWAPAHGERAHEGARDDEDRDGRRDERRDEHRDDRRHERRDDRPGYGYRYEQEGHDRYRGYRGDDWDDDYGVVRGGRCNTDAVLGVAGAVTGGIIGSRTASPGNRGVATVIGAIAGGIIGSAVGNAIDDGDRACLGHSFELVRIGQPVVWVNPRSHVAWRVVPLRDVSPDCREFDLRRDYRGRVSHERTVACRRGRGDWEFRGR